MVHDKLTGLELNQLSRLAQMTTLLHAEILRTSGSRDAATAAVKGAMPELTRKAFDYED